MSNLIQEPTNTSAELVNKVLFLQDRAHMLRLARNFFADRNILEVDCPLIAKGACVDLHINLMEVKSSFYGTRYLHSSPEYFMKRLLSEGIGDIYQLAHVFRDEECSPKHNPEFMMAEWYRLDFSFEQMIGETLAFIQLFIGKKDYRQITYRQALKKYCGLDYVSATMKELSDTLKKNGIEPYPGIEEEGRDALLNLIIGTLVEPHFQELTVLKYFPGSQASLAKKIQVEEEEAALRFEIYYKGIELANGYFELLDAKEQRARLEEANAERKRFGKNELPIDEAFLKALEKGMPECTGVAVGFDRLMMLRHNLNSIEPIFPFVWSQA